MSVCVVTTLPGAFADGGSDYSSGINCEDRILRYF